MADRAKTKLTDEFSLVRSFSRFFGLDASADGLTAAGSPGLGASAAGAAGGEGASSFDADGTGGAGASASNDSASGLMVDSLRLGTEQADGLEVGTQDEAADFHLGKPPSDMNAVERLIRRKHLQMNRRSAAGVKPLNARQRLAASLQQLQQQADASAAAAPAARAIDDSVLVTESSRMNPVYRRIRMTELGQKQRLRAPDSIPSEPRFPSPSQAPAGTSGGGFIPGGHNRVKNDASGSDFGAEAASSTSLDAPLYDSYSISVSRPRLDPVKRAIRIQQLKLAQRRKQQQQAPALAATATAANSKAAGRNAAGGRPLSPAPRTRAPSSAVTYGLRDVLNGQLRHQPWLDPPHHASDEDDSALEELQRLQEEYPSLDVGNVLGVGRSQEGADRKQVRDGTPLP